MRVRRSGWSILLASLAVSVACNTSTREEAEVQPVPDSASPAATEQRSDAGITMSVQAKYFSSDTVKARDIDVDTDSGVVTLRGAVDNETQRQEAEQIARSVAGVVRVDNQLTVGAAAGAAARRDDTAADSPGWITTKIQAQYFMNPSLKPWNISVNTSDDGVVTLQGRIDSAEDRAEAVRIARNTDGVRDVQDLLRSERETAATSGSGTEQQTERMADTVGDAWITTKVQSRFFMDPNVKGRNIDVETANGIVTLSGTVASEGERLEAMSIARSTDGVREVRDNLSVMPGSSAGDMNRTPGTPADQRSAGARVDDAWITMNVQSKFFMHDTIKAREIDVDTRNGVVTLTGSVPDEAARSAAERLARETNGVSRVVNSLTVSGN
jgi:osmotically-inducible protein OsmY